MMRHTLVSLALFSFALGDMFTQDHPVPREFLSSLLENITIDWGKPPTNAMHLVTESTCAVWFVQCIKTNFKMNKVLVPRYPVSPGSRHQMEYKPEITAYFIPRVENGVMNLGDDDISFSAEESTSTVDSTSEGWQIGAQIFGGGGGSAGVAVSAGFSKTWSLGKGKTKGVSVQTTCRSGFDCRIETWTFHLRVTGHCQLRPVIDCNGEIDPCHGEWGLTCSQYNDFRHRHCLTCDSASSFFHEKCQVQTPILDQAGHPFTRLVRISERMANNESVNDNPDLSTTPAKAINFEDGLYELDSGEWYDPKDDTYYGKLAAAKWYHKPAGTPKPNLNVGGGVKRYCKDLPCHDELERLYGNRRLLLDECRRRRDEPLSPLLRANVLLLLPLEPNCGRKRSLLRLQPSEYRRVCLCLQDKGDSRDACPDCKTGSCYRELIRLYGGSLETLENQCRWGELRGGRHHRDYELPDFPFESLCGKVMSYTDISASDFGPVCDCLEENEAIGREEEKEAATEAKKKLSKRQKPPRFEKKEIVVVRDVEIEFLDEAPL
ncbi:hypothetical protein L249_1184 [Ophiocordyceps polyrhachis-furcata BCC 54312]|uniref:Uncharacterized protein n=1 Tax=Ophiocordyceps polyrhachis-furcata BCC 54312 TaxID=1330021 RepID=A0A367LE73_9HYPO|nr:hypothetical protein L249_1184 [Ophiocordyceps polyrhachis-furcata BCC 54312]